MNIKVLFSLAFLLTITTGSTRTTLSKIEELLFIAQNYSEVERSVMLLQANNTIISQVPCISPLFADDFSRISISSMYGNRIHPILNEFKHHSGIDLRGSLGAPVHTTADGVVITTSRSNTLGIYIKIKHSFGFTTIYGHLNKLNINNGDSVRIGQVIGFVGNTGRSTGPHLHYGIKKYGIEQNPLPYCYLYFRWIKMLKSEEKK